MAVNDIAAGALVGTFTPQQLFAGDAPVTSDSGASLVAAIAKYEVIALTNTGITTFVTGTHTADQAVIAAQAITAIGQQVPYFKSGCFNHAILTWPAALNTYALRKGFFGNRALSVGKIM